MHAYNNAWHKKREKWGQVEVRSLKGLFFYGLMAQVISSHALSQLALDYEISR